MADDTERPRTTEHPALLSIQKVRILQSCFLGIFAANRADLSFDIKRQQIFAFTRIAQITLSTASNPSSAGEGSSCSNRDVVKKADVGVADAKPTPVTPLFKVGSDFKKEAKHLLMPNQPRLGRRMNPVMLAKLKAATPKPIDPNNPPDKPRDGEGPKP